MFSVISVCLSVQGGKGETILALALDLPLLTIRGSPWTCTNLFNLNLNSRVPPLLKPHMFKFVQHGPHHTKTLSLQVGGWHSTEMPYCFIKNTCCKRQSILMCGLCTINLHFGSPFHNYRLLKHFTWCISKKKCTPILCLIREKGSI